MWELWFRGIEGSKDVGGPGSRSSPRKKKGRKVGSQSACLPGMEEVLFYRG